MKLPSNHGWKAGLAGAAVSLVMLVTAALDGCHLVAGVEEGELATGGAGAGTGGSAGADGGSSTSGTGGGGGAGASSIGGTGPGGSGGAGGNGPTYAEEVLADNPLAYWRLGENTTPTAYDATGNGHDGTFMGGVTVSVPGAIVGDADTAVHFDGSGEVTVGDVFGFEGNEPFSVEAWIQPEIDAASFIGKADKPSGYIGWLIYFQGSALTVRRGMNLDGPLPLQSQFTHIVATYDGFTLRQYQNGQLVSDIQTSAAVAAHSRPFTFGRTHEWAAFQGVMDEVAVYGANLPPARILAHYEVGVGLR